MELFLVFSTFSIFNENFAKNSVFLLQFPQIESLLAPSGRQMNFICGTDKCKFRRATLQSLLQD